ncbi:MAG: hypothetical protein FWD63_08275 [Propionibacteriaceae bacterium]|nr:hypothetical protein [Propionibacteriaceae bacterium]
METQDKYDFESNPPAGSTTSDATAALASVADSSQAAREVARKPRWYIAGLAVCIAVLLAAQGFSAYWLRQGVIVLVLVSAVVIIASYRRTRRAVVPRLILVRQRRVFWIVFVVLVVVMGALTGILTLDSVRAVVPWWGYTLIGLALGATVYLLANWSWTKWVRQGGARL